MAVLTLGLLGGTAHALTAGHGTDGAQRHALFLAGAATPERSPSPSPTAAPTGAQALPSPAPSLSPEPGGTATPAPGSENGDGDSGGGTGGEAEPCSLLDLGCKAREAVTDWFRELVETASGPTFELLGSTVLATPEMDSAEMLRARQLWGVSQTIANTCFVLLVTLAGVLLMAGTSLPSEIGIKDLLPRAVLAFLAANLSQTLIGYGIGFANGLATAFLDSGGRRIDPGQAAGVLGRGVEASINTGGVFLILEHDTGSETLQRVAGKLAGYAALAESTGINTPVLFWLPSRAREINLRKVLGTPQVPVATAVHTPVTDPQGPTGPVWLPAGTTGPRLRLAQLAELWPVTGMTTAGPEEQDDQDHAREHRADRQGHQDHAQDRPEPPQNHQMNARERQDPYEDGPRNAGHDDRQR